MRTPLQFSPSPSAAHLAAQRSAPHVVRSSATPCLNARPDRGRTLPDASVPQRYCQYDAATRVYRTDQNDAADGLTASNDEDATSGSASQSFGDRRTSRSRERGKGVLSPIGVDNGKAA